MCFENWHQYLIITIKRIVINKTLVKIILIMLAREMIEKSFISNGTCKGIHKKYSKHVFNLALRVHAGSILKVILMIWKKKLYQFSN